MAVLSIGQVWADPAAAGTKWYKCEVTGDCGSATTEARKIEASRDVIAIGVGTVTLNKNNVKSNSAGAAFKTYTMSCLSSEECIAFDNTAGSLKPILP